MNQLPFEYKSIVHSAGGKSPFCNVKDATVSGPDGTERHLFLLMEMPADDVFSHQLFDDLFETYHQNIEGALVEHVGEDAFEFGLRALNKSFDALSEEVSEKWFSHIRALVAFSEGSEIHMSPIGNVHAFYCTNQNVQDVLGQRPVNAAIDPKSAFSQVISGEFIPKSGLVLSTDRLIEMFSPERIKRTIIEKSIDEAAKLFSGIIIEDSEHPPIAAIFFKPDEELLAPSISEKIEDGAPGTEDSMLVMVAREENTKDLLSSGFFVSIKRLGSSISGLSKGGFGKVKGIKIGKKKKSSKGEKIPVAITQDNPIEAKETTNETPPPDDLPLDSPFEVKGTDEQKKGRFGRFIKFPSSVASGTQAVKTAMTQLTSDTKSAYKKKPVKGLKNRLIRGTARVVLIIANLSWPRRILLVLAFLLVFIFAQSVVFTGRTSLSKEDVQNFDSAIVDADGKINEAKAALLYNNEEGARSYFNEAKALLSQIPEDTRLFENEASPRLAVIQEEEKSLNKEEDVTPGSSTPFPEGAQNMKLAFLGETLYAASGSDGKVYKLENGSWVEFATADQSWNTFHTSDGRLIGVLADGQIAEVIAEGVETISFAGPEGLDLADAAFFSNKLYILDRAQKQVWKLIPDGTTYGSASEWIADEKSGLGTPKSLHIDGNIYILNEEGVLTKWFNGIRQRSFSTDVSLSGGFNTFVSSENELYLLAPGDSRIVLVKKEGGLIRQLLSDQLSSAGSITVHPENTSLFTSSSEDMDTFSL